jgi:peroxiredoxin
MKKTILPVGLYILIFLYACQPGSRQTDQAIIMGQVTDYNNKKVVLSKLDIKKIHPIDSITTDDEGKFDFKIMIDDAGFYLLKFDDDITTLVLKKGDKISLVAHADNISGSYHVEGSDESSLLEKFEHFTQHNLKKVDSLKVLFDINKYEPNFYAIRSLLDQAYLDIFYDQKTFAGDLLIKHPSSLSSLIIINRRFGHNKVFDDEEDFHYFKMVDSGLTVTYPNNKHFFDHHQKVLAVEKKNAEFKKSQKRLAIGKSAPEIIREDYDGRSYSLSALHGKTVLLYFWAAWDAKSRKTNHKLTELYDKYKAKGFEIYAFSLDSHKQVWEKAIKLDKLHWINVSDLKNIYSPVIKLYQVPEKLPYFYIIDEEGKILDKGADFEKIRIKLENHLTKLIIISSDFLNIVF